jgi:hypothetical protein
VLCLLLLLPLFGCIVLSSLFTLGLTLGLSCSRLARLALLLIVSGNDLCILLLPCHFIGATTGSSTF